MTEYPIQKRWPYKPQRSRVPSITYMLVSSWYCINFYDKSADYIRVWIAYARRRFFAK